MITGLVYFSFQLTLKNSEAEKKIDTLISRKRELEEEKLTVQRQVEKKESEINDINTKLNEKNAEIQGLKSDKQALEQQIVQSNCSVLFFSLQSFFVVSRQNIRQWEKQSIPKIH